MMYHRPGSSSEYLPCHTGIATKLKVTKKLISCSWRKQYKSESSLIPLLFFWGVCVCAFFSEEAAHGCEMEVGTRERGFRSGI